MSAMNCCSSEVGPVDDALMNGSVESMRGQLPSVQAVATATSRGRTRGFDGGSTRIPGPDLIGSVGVLLHRCLVLRMMGEMKTGDAVFFLNTSAPMDVRGCGVQDMTEGSAHNV